MKSYPYIGKANLDGALVVFYGKGYGRCFHSDNWGKGVRRDYNEQAFTNITREYLEGKCVKIESPEHSEFMQKLAFNAGFKWCDGDDRITKMSVGSYLNFRLEIGLTYSSCVDYEQITITLPPKAEPETKEWPQVGDEVFIQGPDFTGRVLGFYGDWCWIDRGEHLSPASYNIYSVKKPKTEAEILRDEIYKILEGYVAIDEIRLILSSKIAELTTKKPQ